MRLEPVMSAVDALAIYRLLADAGIRTWINGGWGVDALAGRQTRPHADLDIFMEDSQVGLLRSLLSSQGFSEVEGGRPANFVLRDARGREVDVHAVALDDGGDGHYPMADGRTWVCPAEGLAGRGTVLGHPVRCFTAELQLQCYSGYELGKSDRHDIAVLRREFPTAVALPSRTTA